MCMSHNLLPYMYLFFQYYQYYFVFLKSYGFWHCGSDRFKENKQHKAKKVVLPSSLFSSPPTSGSGCASVSFGLGAGATSNSSTKRSVARPVSTFTLSRNFLLEICAARSGAQANYCKLPLRYSMNECCNISWVPWSLVNYGDTVSGRTFTCNYYLPGSSGSAFWVCVSLL